MRQLMPSALSLSSLLLFVCLIEFLLSHVWCMYVCWAMRSIVRSSVCLSGCLPNYLFLSICEGVPSIHPSILWMLKGPLVGEREGDGRGSVCLFVEGTTPLGRFMRPREGGLSLLP